MPPFWKYVLFPFNTLMLVCTRLCTTHPVCRSARSLCLLRFPLYFLLLYLCLEIHCCMTRCKNDLHGPTSNVTGAP